MTATARDDGYDHALGEEFEHEAVPLARRQSGSARSPRSGSASR